MFMRIFCDNCGGFWEVYGRDNWHDNAHTVLLRLAKTYGNDKSSRLSVLHQTLTAKSSKPTRANINRYFLLIFLMIAFIRIIKRG